jgi:hypothetical protein
MNNDLIQAGRIEQRILILRGQRVMLDRDLAILYGIQTKVLKQAVSRHLGRFPADFMFVFTKEEFMKWRSQFVTSISDRMGLRHAPMAFTEQGVAMLSGILNSDRAVEVNIAIMRAFVKLRQILSAHADLAHKLDELEQKYDSQFRVVFDALRQLMNPPAAPRKQIGYGVRERIELYGVKASVARLARSRVQGDLSAEQIEKIETMLN